jgi:transglutaminase-like putative cysteine protease
MTWRLQVVHRSGYTYEEPVLASFNEARMTPLTDLHQTTVTAELTVEPHPAAVLRYWDYWGTQVTAFDLHDRHDKLVITSTCIVETEPPAPLPPVCAWDDLRTDDVRDAQHEFLAPTGYAPADADLAARAVELADADGADPASAARAICTWVHGAMRYEQGVTAVHTSAVEALTSGRGVCQDYAHLALVLLRLLGIPARYVSGYLHPVPDAVPGETVVGQSHAWVDVFTGGWWGYDPTNDLPVGEQHVAVARGRDYGDVAPLRGLYSGGASSSLDVDVAVTRLR